MTSSRWISRAAIVSLLTGPAPATETSGNGSTRFKMETTLEDHPGEAEGGRNPVFCRLVGGYLHRRGVDRDLLDHVLRWNARCKPPKKEEKIVQDVFGLLAKHYGKTAIPATAEEASGKLLLTCYSEIEAEEIDWLWPSRIALGKLTLVVGPPGIGKSFLMCDVAARVSQGGLFPDGTQSTRGRIIYATAEDGAGDTIRPRLDAAGADVAMIYDATCVVVAGEELEIRLDQHIGNIDATLADHPEVRLVVVDPLSAYLGAIDSHRDTEVRQILRPLARVAEERRVAIVGICHLSKKDAPSFAINRVLGSIGFIAAAPMAWLVHPDPDDDERKLLLPLKGNIAVKATGLAYRIIHPGKLDWEELPVLMATEDVFDRQETPRGEAKGSIEAILCDGPVKASEILKKAKADGIAERTLKTAKKELKIVSRRAGSEWSGVSPIPPKMRIPRGAAMIGSLSELAQEGQGCNSVLEKDSLHFLHS